MRTLSATLEAAQKSNLLQPYPKVEIVDQRVGLTRLAWDRLYDGDEPDKFHDCCIAGDGALLRLTGGPSQVAKYQRVPNPDENSNYSQWTNVTTGTEYHVTMSANGSEVIQFITRISDGLAQYRISTDYGQNFGNWNWLFTLNTANTFVSAAHKPNGDVTIAYNKTNVLRVKQRLSGVWQTPVLCPSSFNSITGVSTIYQGDWNIVVTGTDPNDRAGVWQCLFGDGYSAAVGNWTAIKEIMIADNPAISYKLPFLDMPDVFRFFAIEAFSGTESYSRPYWSHGL